MYRNVAALFHQNHGATAYALDAHHLRVVLHAATGDLTTVVLTTDWYAGLWRSIPVYS